MVLLRDRRDESLAAAFERARAVLESGGAWTTFERAEEMACMADVWIKFCGCTSSSDVALAAEAGADAFGMIFAPSPRRVTWQAVNDIAAHVPPSIAPVAVFVNPARGEVEKVRSLFPHAGCSSRATNLPSSSRITANEPSRRST